ncbi:hypothetical protein TG4357_00187 [Thalassovita gelatinovora]|uniref:Uncharacterized protein n=1 Tax=Thalassovita gelatinovora TaxID=53501 RepID=A0A0P1F497_THAGE|nr:hypothetical protein [Thalassovita gelatinovora]QIZ79325.1 hypothetical protein HFZ77_01980 [Thalassovita gelatinovora]CUH62576.1 hypothetical protein TG4357_00187 [Thalassovita gelatinovora]SEQ06753.1 hypothetical protein SAMN04488043_10387 [Thalassovita gelatinovora]
MSVSFRIIPPRGLVYVRYEGNINTADSAATFNDYAHHPDCRPGQKQLIDLACVTGFDGDFPKLMELQARKADVFLAEGVQTLAVYYAPSPLTRKIAQMIERSWEPFPGVVAVIQDTEAGALSILGMQMKSFEELLEHTA